MQKNAKSAACAKWLFWSWLLYAVGGMLLLNWQAVLQFGVRLCA